MEKLDLTPTLAAATPPDTGDRLPPEFEDDDSALEKIKKADEAREGFPGEHWLVLGLAIAVWHFTRRDRRWPVRAAGGFAAAALAARAASGREGLSKILRYTPLGVRISRCPPCETPAAKPNANLARGPFPQADRAE